MSAQTKRAAVPLDTLRDTIAGAFWRHVRSYNLAAVATGMGLPPGEEAEAGHSKRLYIKKRILSWPEPELVKLAYKVIEEFGDADLADLLNEIQIGDAGRISELTRRDVLKVLSSIESLFGDTDLYAGLNIISYETLGTELQDGFGFITLTGEIDRHFIRNPDWSPEDLLIRCGALTCTQTKFVRLLEKLIEPVVRRGEEQAQLAEALNKILAADRYRAVVTGTESRHPIYKIQRIHAGVDGRPKNLIFAAINTKPDLYFTDAINNDIAIRNPTDALVYDEHLQESGLRWNTLATWWQVRERLATEVEAKRALYARLLRSVKETHSPGQYAVFYVYYHHFPSLLGEALPALIPEVYLHYDPRTRLERGANPALLRQRMDLLLLLDHGARVIIEVDGSEHYADAGAASPKKYAQMVSEDRRLRLAGYELHHFGGAEFSDTKVEPSGGIDVGPRTHKLVVEFFDKLWMRHGIAVPSG